jgi:hypothetical protein
MSKIHAEDYDLNLLEEGDFFLYSGGNGYAFDPVYIRTPNMLTSPKKLSWYNENHDRYKLYTIHEDQEHCFGGYFITLINRIRNFFSLRKRR